MGSGQFWYQKWNKTCHVSLDSQKHQIKSKSEFLEKLKKSMLTLVKVSFEGFTALLRRVTAWQLFTEIATCVTSKIPTLRIKFSAFLHNDWVVMKIMKWLSPVEIEVRPILGKTLFKSCCLKWRALGKQLTTESH